MRTGDIKLGKTTVYLHPIGNELLVHVTNIENHYTIPKTSAMILYTDFLIRTHFIKARFAKSVRIRLEHAKYQMKN